MAWTRRQTDDINNMNPAAKAVDLGDYLANIGGTNFGSPAALTGAAADGTATTVPRSDHTHAWVWASPASLNGAAADGSATSLARSDHKHAIASLPISALAVNVVEADAARKSQVGSIALSGQNVTWVGISAAVEARVYGSVDISGGVDLSGGSKTVIADPDGASDDTVTFGAGAAGTNQSGAALDTGRFVLKDGVNDIIPLLEENGGIGATDIDVLTSSGAVEDTVYTGAQMAAFLEEAIEAIATGNYDVEYSAATGKFTIDLVGGVTDFSVPWTTADGDEISATLGYTGDDAAVTTAASDVEVRVNVVNTMNDAFSIDVDGGGATACDVAAGAYTLAALDTAIETALTNAAVTGVTVTVAGNKIVFTSGTSGTGSTIALTEGGADFLRSIDATAALKDKTDGTGWAANVADATPAEVAAEITSQATGWTAEVADSNYILLKSATTGGSSSLVMANGTANADLGYTNTDGANGSVSQALDAMADATYLVRPLAKRRAGGTAPGDIELVEKLTDRFGLRVGTGSSTETVEFEIIGATA